LLDRGVFFEGAFMLRDGVQVAKQELSLLPDEQASVIVGNLTADEERDLEDCALDINKAAKSMAWSLIDMGKAASRARDILAKRRDGSFATWIADKCNVGSHMIYGAIRAHESFGHLDFAIVAKMHVGAALLLAQGNTPEQARVIAVELAQAGETVTKAKATAIIAEKSCAIVSPEPAGDRCQNCGATERDEDGDCSKCREPGPKQPAKKEKQSKSEKAKEAATEIVDNILISLPDLVAHLKRVRWVNPTARRIQFDRFKALRRIVGDLSNALIHRTKGAE
jgi:hypothetical protein